jgi:hypothetical protein
MGVDVGKTRQHRLAAAIHHFSVAKARDDVLRRTQGHDSVFLNRNRSPVVHRIEGIDGDERRVVDHDRHGTSSLARRERTVERSIALVIGHLKAAS